MWDSSLHLVDQLKEPYLNYMTPYVCQAAGGMFSAGALFPLEIIKTNLQAHTKEKKSSQEADGGQGDGATTSTGEYEEDKQDEQSLLSTRQTQGHGGQDLDNSPPSVASVAKDIYSREGLGGLYKGAY